MTKGISLPTLEDHSIRVLSSTVRIALIQFRAPSITEKIAVQTDGSERLEWAATDDVRGRNRAAITLARTILEQDPELDFLVFPEYSFNYSLHIEELKSLSAAHSTHLLLGGDAVLNTEENLSFNQGLLILPDGDLKVFGKRFPSPNESKHVAPDPDAPYLRLLWEIEEEKYAIIPMICRDFLEEAPYLPLLKDIDIPTVFVVPMCSPVFHDFQCTANLMLRRLKQGCAVALVSASSNGYSGQTSIFSVQAGEKAGAPVASLSRHEEAVLTSSIRMNELSPTKLTSSGSMAAIHKLSSVKFTYSETEDLSLRTSKDIQREQAERAVINPQLFGVADQEMRIAFLEVERFSRVVDLLDQARFETLAVLGAHDLLITHIGAGEKDLLFAIGGTLNLPLTEHSPSNLRRGRDVGPLDSADGASYFEVERFHKVLGVRTLPEMRLIEHYPEEGDIGNLVRLGRDWHDPEVDDSFRRIAEKNKWVIARTETQPGEISSVMTIAIRGRSSELRSRLRIFRREIIGPLLDDPRVTSIFEGTGHSINVDFLLRTTTSSRELFSFIDEIHSASNRISELIATRTFIVVARLSDLDMAQALFPQDLPNDVLQHAKKRFYPLLDKEDEVIFNSQDRSIREEILRSFRDLDIAISNASIFDAERRTKWSWSEERFLGSIAEGVVLFFFSSGEEAARAGMSAIRESFLVVSTQIEGELLRIIVEMIPSETLASVKEKERLPSGKKPDELNFREKIRTVARAASDENLGIEVGETLVKKLETGNYFRNLLVHDGAEKLRNAGVDSLFSTLTSLLSVLPVLRNIGF